MPGADHGIRQRLGIVVVLLGEPGVLLLDEPVSGLDPEGIGWVRDLLRGLAAEGGTLFLAVARVLVPGRAWVASSGRSCGWPPTSMRRCMTSGNGACGRPRQESVMLLLNHACGTRLSLELLSGLR
jgi:hypothetical protein